MNLNEYINQIGFFNASSEEKLRLVLENIEKRNREMSEAQERQMIGIDLESTKKIVNDYLEEKWTRKPSYKIEGVEIYIRESL